MIKYSIDVTLVVEIETDVEHLEIISLRRVGKLRFGHVKSWQVGRFATTNHAAPVVAVVIVMMLLLLLLLFPSEETAAVMIVNLVSPSMEKLFEHD